MSEGASSERLGGAEEESSIDAGIQSVVYQSARSLSEWLAVGFHS